MLQRCRITGTVFYYPRLACPASGGRDLEWIESSGKGRVWTYSHVHVSFCGAEWEDQLPYTVVLVDLDEGPRMMSRLIGEDRESVRVGARVCVRFVAYQGQALPFFALSSDRD